MQRWLEQGSRVPREGEDRLRLCAGERRPCTLDRAALGCGQELPFNTCPWVFHSQVGPGNDPTGPAPLDTYKDKCPRCHPCALEAAI